MMINHIPVYQWRQPNATISNRINMHFSYQKNVSTKRHKYKCISESVDTVAYPGAYSGSTNLYPKALKVKPTSDAVRAEEEEASARIWIPSGDPWLGCLEVANSMVTVAAIPRTIANFARNELPVPVAVSTWLTSNSSITSFCFSGVSLDIAPSKASAPSCWKLLILLTFDEYIELHLWVKLRSKDWLKLELADTFIGLTTPCWCLHSQFPNTRLLIILCVCVCVCFQNDSVT